MAGGKRGKGGKKAESPELYFVRTGRVPKGLGFGRLKKLLMRAVSGKWEREALKRHGKQLLPLPSRGERMYGGPLPKEDLKRIREQAEFAVRKLLRGKSAAERKRTVRLLRGHISSRELCLNIMFGDSTTRRDPKELRAKENLLYHYIGEFGEPYFALVQEPTKKVFFSKGWSKVREAHSAPLHESIHLMQRLGLIERDVPFAQAADRLHRLESGITAPDSRIRLPTRGEFDRKPQNVTNDGMTVPGEPNWSYSVGDRIAKWLFLKVEKKKRWEYLRLRTLGKTHREAKEKLGLASP